MSSSNTRDIESGMEKPREIYDYSSSYEMNFLESNSRTKHANNSVSKWQDFKDSSAKVDLKN